MVAEALDKRLRDNIKDARSSMFSGDNLSFSQLRQVHSMTKLLRYCQGVKQPFLKIGASFKVAILSQC